MRKILYGFRKRRKRKDENKERNITVSILQQSTNDHIVEVKQDTFQYVPWINDQITVKRKIYSVEELQFMENNMDKLLDMRIYFF